MKKPTKKVREDYRQEFGELMIKYMGLGLHFDTILGVTHGMIIGIQMQHEFDQELARIKKEAAR